MTTYAVETHSIFILREATYEQAVKFTEKVKTELLLQFGALMDQENYNWEIDEVLPPGEVVRRLEEHMDRVSGLNPLLRGMVHHNSDGTPMVYRPGMFGFAPPDPTTRQPDPVNPDLPAPRFDYAFEDGLGNGDGMVPGHRYHAVIKTAYWDNPEFLEP